MFVVLVVSFFERVVAVFVEKVLRRSGGTPFTVEIECLTFRLLRFRHRKVSGVFYTGDPALLS